MTRRQEREQAFFILFEWDFNRVPTPEIYAVHLRPDSLVTLSDFSRGLADTAVEHIDEIDELIARYSKKWNKERISRVSLAIMRVAVCEILYFDDIPASVSINEAVELAKTYAGERDAPFVNGILGSVARRGGGEQ